MSNGPSGARAQAEPAQPSRSVLVAEQRRLEEDRKAGRPWKKWGPYLSERQWGTVREDYSESGDAWNYFTHDQARSRAYRWAKMALAASRTTASGSALRSRSGTSAIRS
ncbi:hypothetical protein [Rhizobium sp. IBUN]|uniref:hypothetical protein n=1 Tax=Rhizobium sp. IBUN TaxID=1042326 RepID=UPI0032AEDE00